MKELLLTWYGITDLRAALGFETGDGPVVGAVRAHPYTGVVVLGYVRPDEQATDQEAFTRELRSTHEEMERGDRAAAGRFVARFANTPAAHQHVEAWLHCPARGAVPGDRGHRHQPGADRAERQRGDLRRRRPGVGDGGARPGAVAGVALPEPGNADDGLHLGLRGARPPEHPEAVDCGFRPDQAS